MIKILTLSRYFRPLPIILLLGLCVNTQLLQAQTSINTNSDRTPGYWTLGLNAGFSYQSSDVRAQLQGGGWGLTLAKNLYYRPGSPIAFDLRGRFLFARQFGLDGEPLFEIDQDEALNGTRGPDYTQYPANLDIAEGFVYPNHRTTVGELALEGVLSFNRLRERTKVHLALYGGIGIDWYRTKLNQLDATETPYFSDYAELFNNGSRNVRSELRNSILDDSYETLANDFGNSGKIGLMPSLGIELGYQVTPRFSIMAGHRVTFSGTDDLDGEPWSTLKHGEQDLYHYTQFGLRWILEPGRRSGQPPVIAFEQPETERYFVSTLPIAVRARISHVSSKVNVSASLNGNPIDFDFGNGSFRKIVTQLEPGENTFTIRAENRYGSDRESITLIYGTEEPPPPPPVGRAPQITITQPRSTPHRTNLGTADLVASVREVTRQNQVSLIVNGETRSFNFDQRSGQIRTTLALRPGQNLVTIRATNAYGSDEEQTTIIYETAVVDIDPPVVRINNPSNGDRTSSSTTLLRATVRNVSSRSDITMSVRGSRFTDFSFDAARDELTATVPLSWGSNTIEVNARNSSGSDRAQVTVYREDTSNPPPPPLDPRPDVRITRPADGHLTTGDLVSFEASVENVDRRSQIRISVNGRSYQDFTFNANRGRITGTVSLNRGNNTILVEAQTPGGQAQDGINVRSEPPVRPSVSISEPANGTRVRQAEVNFVARTQNVDSRNQITLRVNNRRITDFSFSRGIVRSTIDLSAGNNRIEIEVSNAGGIADASTNVIYEQIRPPSVTITSPSGNPYTTDNQTVEIRAQVSEVERADQISIRYNNRSRTNFNFDRQRQVVTIPLRLSPGSHLFEIEVNTAGGSDREEKTLVYRDTPAPTVDITAPDDGSQQSSSRATVRATITDVSNRGYINFRLNGNNSNDFDFRGGTFQATVNLRPGSNTIEITAENERGQAADQVQVTYEEPVAIDPPRITFSRPSQPGTTVSESRQIIAARVFNVTKAGDVSVRVNNRLQRGVRFDSRTGQVQLTLNLQEGNNSIAITAQNEGGVVTESTNITYTPPSAGPTVAISSVSRPVINPMAPGVGSSTVRATITGVNNRSQVAFILNGESIEGFDFAADTGEFVGEIQLSRGENVIIIRATSAEGTAEDQRTIDF